VSELDLFHAASHRCDSLAVLVVVHVGAPSSSLQAALKYFASLTAPTKCVLGVSIRTYSSTYRLLHKKLQQKLPCAQHNCDFRGRCP
jgi:hypothetical protein